MVGYVLGELTKLTYPEITFPDDVYTDLELLRRLIVVKFRDTGLRNGMSIRMGPSWISCLAVQFSVPGIARPCTTSLRWKTSPSPNVRMKHYAGPWRRAKQVLGIVAHDLRNPLSNIILACSTLQHGGHEPEPHPKEMISRAAARMNRLIQDLLDALVEAGQLKVEQKRVSATNLVFDAVKMQGPLASSSGVDVRLTVESGLHDVLGDRDRILQVFENLIGNAFKFTKTGGHITVGAARRDLEVMFWVADNGPGVAAENLPHVFDQFWRVTPEPGALAPGSAFPSPRESSSSRRTHMGRESIR
jgi:hypothetical protein